MVFNNGAKTSNGRKNSVSIKTARTNGYLHAKTKVGFLSTQKLTPMDHRPI